MSELSALAGSEGYEVRDDDAKKGFGGESHQQAKREVAAQAEISHFSHLCIQMPSLQGIKSCRKSALGRNSTLFVFFHRYCAAVISVLQYAIENEAGVYKRSAIIQ